MNGVLFAWRGPLRHGCTPSVLEKRNLVSEARVFFSPGTVVRGALKAAEAFNIVIGLSHG